MENRRGSTRLEDEIGGKDEKSKEAASSQGMSCKVEKVHLLQMK